MVAVFSHHAEEQLIFRRLSREMVYFVLENPLQETFVDNLWVYDGIILEDNKQYLLRIFINREKEPPVIVTVYKTSKIRKYYESDL